jgi:carbon-monoxide dehydrogenase medium subunit
MKPPPFDYHVPETVEEACVLKAEHGSDAAVLAGGQSLIPLMSSRRMTPRVLVDIKRIPELQTIARANDSLVVAAAVRQSRLHDDAEVARALPLLAEGARHIGHPETRHRGTVGGSLAHADPVAELPTLAVALGAEIVARNAGGARRVPAAEYFMDARSTALAPDELIVEVHYPAPSPQIGWGFAEIARRHGDPAMATAVALVEIGSDGTIASATVTLGAVSGRPRRAHAVEAALQGAPSTTERIVDAAREAGDLVEREPEARDGVGPTPYPPSIPVTYRRRLAEAAVAQALTKALARANGGEAS